MSNTPTTSNWGGRGFIEKIENSIFGQKSLILIQEIFEILFLFLTPRGSSDWTRLFFD